MAEKKRSSRLWVQLIFTALSNGYLAGFAKGRIFTGKSKALCLPGLNCYSCPGALGSCPIGALQATLGSRNFHFAFYITGFLMIVGAVLGRFVCGWLCPFGLVQDLLYRIPIWKGLRNRLKKRLPVWDCRLKYLKYAVLAVFVLLLPLFVVDIVGQGSPWFCKYICPAGILEGGIPLALVDSGIRAALSWLFAWKGVILVTVIVLSLLLFRPFCRFLCPLGAIYGLFNPIALYRFRIDRERCTDCGSCEQACPLRISVRKTPNSPDCIRCGACRHACPHDAIRAGFCPSAHSKTNALPNANVREGK